MPSGFLEPSSFKMVGGCTGSCFHLYVTNSCKSAPDFYFRHQQVSISILYNLGSCINLHLSIAIKD